MVYRGKCRADVLELGTWSIRMSDVDAYGNVSWHFVGYRHTWESVIELMDKVENGEIRPVKFVSL